MTTNILKERLDKGPVICAEGFLFEIERRGYMASGEFVPMVSLDHPEVLENLHREFQHAGSDIVEAFTYNGHREKMRVRVKAMRTVRIHHLTQRTFVRGEGLASC